MNITEKILAKSANKTEVQPDETINANIDIAMSHDGTSPPTIKVFEKLTDKVWDPEKIVLVFDHNVPANTIGSAEFQQVVREFGKKQNIKNMYIQGEGVCHQVLPEMGHIKPSTVVVGADSHTCTYGAFGAFSTGLGATDLALVYATGQTWIKVPHSLKLNVNGTLGENTYSKDVILNIIKTLGSYGATYKALEFHGDTIDNMSPDARMTMTNMAIECGAKNGIMIPNKQTEEYLAARGVTDYEITTPDKDAEYEKVYDFDVDDLQPQVACPHNVDNVEDVDKVSGTTINQAVLGSCTNGRYEDLEQAAEILKGNKVHPDVQLLVFPASRKIYQDAIDSGIIQTLLDSNAIICNPGCGPCLGAHMGVMDDNMSCISTTNRNFLGRMGSAKSFVYLSNPKVVAASAIRGEITNPSDI
ncbi:MAG: homoaconitase large subunit [Methanosphaera sp.]|uniref:homoaconitase large subunit n=1 Tax=Methanosphaera sp. TaxID=2666342 RepID=UPI0025D77AD7|nr:homoaconitase large subunit [Methanosphaera sp.]MCI5867194.1 homoaconitase large subunit [Methanosphaera sp.]MDD6534738.1 homoaconitase large subunit [Methanosphaera sp.]MDY3955594.1 homoaconitase large subunit [Methanosphaera sp.]